ncbi:fructosamine kinase family protein [Absicoccus intestinalis]|uniref:Fructosamine kinase family protein n=1 Tax=Absicoccus intestinalis TaxID=2926319 RepID=A0ABU4WNW3_9FIRM|nr:fructosamine kinase family protein [Absicoccus sp. CLA-KB-P134]MDX8417177.1 fructosamine kinase family protein [Absicoccus sp. CLA-KB-P134]
MSEFDKIVDKKVLSYHSVAGGDINKAYQVKTEQDMYFIKMNTISNLDMFIQEKKGIEAIAACHVIGTPHILQMGTTYQHAYLLMDYIERGKPIASYWDVFAQELACMHSSFVGDQFGFSSDNYIGSTPQSNPFCGSWVTFFKEYRLRPMLVRNEENLSRSDRQRIIHIMEHLDELLIEPEHPSLVHGDLWSGNVMTGPDGKAWLIDPACYYGDAEVDLAMTELFGGFPPSFYTSYRQYGCLRAGYEKRKYVYNLYHLLNHLYLFGYGYYGSVIHCIEKIEGSW